MAHVKSVDGYDVKVPSVGQVTYNSVAGSIGLANAILGNGNGNGLLGGLFGNRNGNCGCESDHTVNRYELALEQQLAAKDSRIALLEANTFTDDKMLEMYKYFDGELRGVREFICEQRVRNQGTADAVRELDKKIDTSVALEAERRKCADERLVSYMNGTFAPKVIVGFTPDTASTTPAPTFNPLAECGC